MKKLYQNGQKKFLAQKAISRYLMQELADRDLGNKWLTTSGTMGTVNILKHGQSEGSFNIFSL